LTPRYTSSTVPYTTLFRSFHGDLVENFRNSALDANTWTRNLATDRSISGRPAPFRFNQFGFDISGPIFIPHKFNSDRSKLFFLRSEEHTSELQSPDHLVCR